MGVKNCLGVYVYGLCLQISRKKSYRQRQNKPLDQLNQDVGLMFTLSVKITERNFIFKGRRKKDLLDIQ